MTAEEIASAAIQAVQGYTIEATPSGLIGRPFSPERIQNELALLRRSLVEPKVVRASGPDLDVQMRDAWLVARHEEDVVFFDEQTSQYGLGMLASENLIDDIHVYGDLVGCFMAR